MAHGYRRVMRYSARSAQSVLLSICALLLYFFLGQWLHQHWLPTVPPAISGVLLLFVTLLLLGEIPPWLDVGVSLLLRHFTLFLLPPSVGVIAVWPQIKAHWPGFCLTLLLSTFIPLYAAAYLYQFLEQRERRL